MAYASAGQGGYGASGSVIHHELSDHSVLVPDTELLFTAQFHRAGPDLVLTGRDGAHHLIPGYFASEHHPALVAPNGAHLSPDVVDLLAGSPTPGHYAQAQPSIPPDAIGKMEKVVGDVTVMRNGVAVTLHVGDAVFKSDVVQTGSQSMAGIGFPDGTALNLVANTRMALSEYSYDPNGTSNSALFSLVEGTFQFIAGKVAHTGDMKIATPIATMGIRGTTGFVEQHVGSVTSNLGNVNYFSYGLVNDYNTDSHGAYDLFVLNPDGTNTQFTVSDVRVEWDVIPGAPGQPPQILAVPLTNSRIAFLSQSFRDFFDSHYQAMTPQSTGDHGSSTPPDFELPAPTLPPQHVPSDTTPQQLTINTTSGPAQSNPTPSELPAPPPNAALTAIAMPISAIVGAPITATVATFTDANSSAAVGEFTATINWGDGTSSTGTITENNGVFSVAGTHAYAAVGNDPISVTIADVGGSTATATNTATVADAALTPTVLPISATEGAPITATVATFTDANPNAAVGDFTATINWGDGHTSTGAVTENNGVFSVAGTHTYAAVGNDPISVTIADVGGSTATATNTATVADAALTPTAMPISATEGAPITATVATFTDANPNAAVGDFTATINWGDGHTSTGTVTENNGVFSVAGTHTYAEAGSDPISVTIADVGGSTATATNTATVADAALSQPRCRSAPPKGHRSRRRLRRSRTPTRTPPSATSRRRSIGAMAIPRPGPSPRITVSSRSLARTPMRRRATIRSASRSPTLAAARRPRPTRRRWLTLR